MPTHTPAHSTSISDTLFQVQEALAANATRINTSVDQLEAGVTQTATATSVITGAIADITSANQTVQLAKDTASLEAQNSTIDAFEAGGGTDLQVELMSRLAEDIQNVNRLQDEKADIVDDEHTGIDILDNIINQFRHQGVSAELQVAEREQATSAEQIRQITASAESISRANAVTKRTVNRGTIQANYEKLGAQGTLQAAKEKLASIHSNATSMARLVSADKTQVNNLISLYRLEGEAKEREVAVETRKFRREQMEQERKEWELSLPKQQADLKSSELRLAQAQKMGPDQIATATLNREAAQKRADDSERQRATFVRVVQQGQVLAGLLPGDPDIIMLGLNSPGEVGRRYAKFMEMGSSPRGAIDNTPADVVETLSLVAPSGNVKPTKGLMLLRQITELQEAKYAKIREARGTVPKDDATLKANYNRTADEFIASKVVNIVTNDASNPYAAPPFTVLEGVTSVRNEPLYIKVLQPMKMKETNPQTIIDAAVAAILAKTVTAEQAGEGIVAIFKAAAAINNEQDDGFRRVGLPSQTTYNTTLQRPATPFELLKGFVLTPMISRESLGFKESTVNLGATIAVDLMNETKVDSVLIKLLSTTKAAAPTAKSTSNP